MVTKKCVVGKSTIGEKKCAQICVYVHESVCMCAHEWIYMFTWVGVCMSVCVHLCKYVYIQICLRMEEVVGKKGMLFCDSHLGVNVTTGPHRSSLYIHI